jgi:hypothetical protein
MRATNLQQVQLVDELQTRPSLGWCNEELATSSQLSSSSHRIHWFNRVRERLRLGPLEFSNFITLLALDVVLELVACSP